ncbi:MAG: DUF4832 domain-containing protein [Candidatus Symbiothrix sp.]|jgi:hypothetical protein|nr:DUF4832 domain-containing protein [Candidatus Symbiothrix sp.]
MKQSMPHKAGVKPVFSRRLLTVACLLTICFTNLLPLNAQDIALTSIAPKQIENITPLWNPDRGLHLESIYQISDSRIFNPYGRGAGQGQTGNEVYPEGFMDTRNQDFQSFGDSISLTQLYIYMTDYYQKDQITQSGLDNIQILFDGLREKKVKAILRFAYKHDHGGDNPGATRTLKHIQQLKPLIQANIDVIAVIQAGFIGTWGEWTPRYSTTENNSIVKALLDALPSEYGIEMRYTYLKTDLKSSVTTEDYGRIGFANDYFTTGLICNGSDFCPGDNQYRQVEEESFTTWVSGEIPYNENSSYGFSSIMKPESILTILKAHHYSAMDITQNFTDNIAYWKTAKMYPERLRKINVFFDENYFLDSNGKTVPRSLYQFIRDHLGYRLNLLNSSTVSAQSGDLVYNLKITNTGFATVLNPKQVYLVLIDESNRIVKEIELSTVKPKNWQPFAKGQPAVLLTHTISGSVPAGVSGKYKVGLWIPDSQPSVKNNPAFSIKLALDNKAITHWTNAEGTHTVNIIGEVTF